MKPPIFIAVVALAAAPARADAPAKLTFSSAIELALGQNPDIAIAREGVAGADAQAAGARARRLPVLSIEAQGSLYREPYALPFGGMTFTLYHRDTTATSITVSEPLTGLAYLSELVGAAEHAAAASRDDYDRVRLDTAYRTADAYIRVLEARASADVAHRSVTDIQSELDRAIQLRAADTYTDIDVLRFRSAKAAADQGALRADTAAETALASLVLQLGLHDGAAIDVADDLPATPPAMAMTLDQALARAIAARPELRAAHDQIEAAEHTRKSARDALLPDIRAVAVWTHLTGVQPFEPEDAEFLGVRVSWNIWDWGSTYDAEREARASVHRAELTAQSLVDQVRLDVRTRWLDARTAFDSLAAAQTQQQTADEALRLQKVRFDAAAATTTDVLDAETDAAKARLAFAVARYDYYLALVALARSVGDLPSR